MIDINALISQAISNAITTQLSETLKSIDTVLAAQAERIAALEHKDAVESAGIVSLLDTASPEFVDAVELIAERVVEDKLSDHTSNYDHDEYDRAVKRIDDMEDPDDTVRYVLRDSLRSAIDSI